MFLSAEGGSGKTTTIQTVWIFCKYFCSEGNTPFDNMVFRKTALPGSSAFLFSGVTLYSACKLNMSQSTIFYEEDCQSNMVLVVDVTSI